MESPASSDDGAAESAAAGFSLVGAALEALGAPAGRTGDGAPGAPEGRIDGEAPGAPEGRIDGGAPGAPGVLDAPLGAPVPFGAPVLGAPAVPFGAPGGGRGRKPASMGRCGPTPGAPPGGGRGAPGAPGAGVCVLGGAPPSCGGRPGIALDRLDGGAPLGGMGRPGGAAPGAVTNGLLPGGPIGGRDGAPGTVPRPAGAPAEGALDGASGRAVCKNGLPPPGRMYGGAPGRDCGGRTVTMAPAPVLLGAAPVPGLVGEPSGGRAGALLEADACGPVCCGRSAGAPGALLLGGCTPRGTPGGRARGSGRAAVSAVLGVPVALADGASDADAFSARLLVDGRTWPGGGRAPLPTPAALLAGAVGGKPGWAPPPGEKGPGGGRAAPGGEPSCGGGRADQGPGGGAPGAPDGGCVGGRPGAPPGVEAAAPGGSGPRAAVLEDVGVGGRACGVPA